MRLLAIEKELPVAKKDGYEHLLKAEARCIWDLQQSGTLREIFFNADLHSSILVLECEGVAQARLALSTLPLVVAGLIEFEIIPLAPYDGFARLFA